jgi:hypothetical protein
MIQSIDTPPESVLNTVPAHHESRRRGVTAGCRQSPSSPECAGRLFSADEEPSRDI